MPVATERTGTRRISDPQVMLKNDLVPRVRSVALQPLDEPPCRRRAHLKGRLHDSGDGGVTGHHRGDPIKSHQRHILGDAQAPRVQDAQRPQRERHIRREQGVHGGLEGEQLSRLRLSRLLVELAVALESRIVDQTGVLQGGTVALRPLPARRQLVGAGDEANAAVAVGDQVGHCFAGRPRVVNQHAIRHIQGPMVDGHDGNVMLAKERQRGSPDHVEGR